MKTLIGSGKYLNLVQRDGWEWVERRNVSGVVVIAALTNNNELLLVEQFRPPVGTTVMELPAGLAGDIVGEEDEDMVNAAKRELMEETGFSAKEWKLVNKGPVSAGQSTEVIHFFMARDLTQEEQGGGDDSEDITVHRVLVSELDAFLSAAQERGCLVDSKIYSGLYWLLR